MLVSTLEIFTPLFYKRFFDILVSASDKQVIAGQLIQTILIILAFNAAGWLLYRLAGFLNSYFETEVIASLRQRAFNYMIGHSYAFFANNFTGSLVQRVNRFARAFEHLADRILWNIVPLIIRTVGSLIVLYFISPTIALILAGWAALFFVFNFIFSRWKFKYDIQAGEADSRTTGALADAITNQNTIQLFASSEEEGEHFRGVTREQARITRFVWNLETVVDSVQAFLAIAAEFLLFYFSIRFWQEGRITIGSFVLIQTYLVGLIGRLWDFSRVVRDIYGGIADAKEMVEILDTEYEIKDVAGAPALAVPKGAVRFSDVSFRFNKKRNVLDHIDLSIKSGEKIALVGPSGAGKSTIVRLLLRLHDVSEGSITIDGQDIRSVTQESLRSQLSLVPQDPILFHRTLMENIRYGRKEATDEEVKRAAKLAHCDEFIEELPDTYDTYVGERGIKLSGGERQRVAIARAILKNAPILILDEATSSLDSHSEYLIQDALNALMKKKTTIVIAHRLSTIRKMDRILVIDEGRVIEEGTHDELDAKRGGLYRKLWSLQAGGFLPS
jgi:ATP-binding cassette subfamily B protein